MNDIICPHCEKAFKVDETGYEAILEQVRGKEFDREIHEHLKRAEKEKDHALTLATTEAKAALEKLEYTKEKEIKELKFQLREKETSIDATVMRAVKK